ncbi:MAG TPA: DUF4260 domain-containing protein [Phnomibacter sp.]|nr:DUF4260 domain-containing protein [Phnomibacter sp.]
MKNLIKLEEAFMLILAIAGLMFFNVPWWGYTLLLLGPDISMLGYLAGNKTGALTYNLFHHKAIAILVLLIGFYMKAETIMITGIILFGHSSLDRMAGYGLKLNEGFSYTHLGRIGKQPL